MRSCINVWVTSQAPSPSTSTLVDPHGRGLDPHGRHARVCMHTYQPLTVKPTQQRARRAREDTHERASEHARTSSKRTHTYARAHATNTCTTEYISAHTSPPHAHDTTTRNECANMDPSEVANAHSYPLPLSPSPPLHLPLHTSTCLHSRRRSLRHALARASRHAITRSLSHTHALPGSRKVNR